MKNFIYAFILLFATTFCYSQKTVSYVSFFPPANIVHSDVTLTQNNNSFSSNSTVEGSAGYPAKPGGIILGSKEYSTTTIRTMNVVTSSGKPYAINNFKVDNIIKISSEGLIKNINIGEVCDKTPDSCSDVFISASSVSLPYHASYPSDIQINVYVSDTTTINNTNFSVESGEGPENFLPPLPRGHNSLRWVNLRIPGTEECRPYLASYSGGALHNNCAQPD